MNEDAPGAIAIHLSPPQIGCVLALIHANHDGVRAKLQNAGLTDLERVVLEDLRLQLESTREAIEHALAKADQLLSRSGG
jgi:hypothetical protein